MKRFFFVLLLTSCFLLSACGGEKTLAARPLTSDEIEQVRSAFTQIVYQEDENGMVAGMANPISCFFTSYYTDPTQLDLEAFLYNCPVAATLTEADEAEFQVLMAAHPILDGASTLKEMPVPVHRYRKEDISALLTQYAGITADDLVNTDGARYLAEYDAYYNFTSDFGPGFFICAGGEVAEDTARLWSEPFADGTRAVLTLHKDGECWLFASFVKETP